MLDVALSLFALIAGALTLELFAEAWTPLNYQDERGFSLHDDLHEFGEDSQAGNPS